MMGKDFTTKKRKASVPAAEAEKMKKVRKVPSEVAAAPIKKRKATEDAAPVAVKKSKTPKPALEDAPTTKPAKKNATLDKGGEKTNVTQKASKSSKEVKSASKELKSATASTKTKVKQLEPTDESNEDEGDDKAEAEDADEDSEIDDQTEALLKGFESEGDEVEAIDEGGLKEGQPVPLIPTMTNQSKKKLKRLGESDTPETPGVVYVGRIPHGFYEHEMKEYFKQFGTILKLRLSRNRQTGASKHIAWIQFESATVAGIVAKTMDNYLLFSHILKVKVVPDEQIPENLFKGANKRFKKVPWNKIEGRKLQQGASEEVWDKRAEKEQKRRDEKAKKLKEVMDFEFDAPTIKSAEGVAKKVVEQPALTANGDDATKAIEAAAVPQETSKSKKKNKKAKAIEQPSLAANGDDETEAVDAAPALQETGKFKKNKKTKTADEAEETAADVVALATNESKKGKKSKAVKETDCSAEAATVPAAVESTKPKNKKQNAEVVENTEAVSASTGAVSAEIAEKKLKAKKSKTGLVGADSKTSEDKVKKPKKDKKVKAIV